MVQRLKRLRGTQDMGQEELKKYIDKDPWDIFISMAWLPELKFTHKISNTLLSAMLVHHLKILV